MSELSLADLSIGALAAGRRYFPSPRHWEDQVLYFLMLDRFSDGNEKGYLDIDGNPVNSGTTSLFKAADNGNAVSNESDAGKWREAGTRFVGGTLKGLESKLGYLRRLGVTAIWISPLFRQVAVDESYHGYGIQNFLDVDPRFGTREELRQLVESAHAVGIRVILDIIINHTGDVFRYVDGDPFWTGQTFAVKGFRDHKGEPTLPLSRVDLSHNPGEFPNGAIWPAEFQTPDAFTRRGRIRNFDFFPEFLDGDFFSLKDLHHGERTVVDGVDQIDNFLISPTLRFLAEVYKFWIVFADIDGFRLDTVKHMDPGATRFFASVIHEFAESLGKDDFYIIGEITGGREFAYSRLEATGLDAALGISDERIKMNGLVRGEINPSEYFDLFRNSILVGKESHAWFRNKIVTSLDDHDHVDQGENKHRFSAFGYGNLAFAAMALNATTLGIPCIYYGTEQLLDGEGGGEGSDRYIREALFGGDFGAFRSRGRHCFNEEQETFRKIAAVHELRQREATLRRGRQYLREISGDGDHFGYPGVLSGRMLSVVAWSRIFATEEIVCAINTDPDNARTAWVTIDNNLHATGDELKRIHSSAAGAPDSVRIEARNGKAVQLTVPKGGFVAYK